MPFPPTIKETIDYLAKKGRNYGLVTVHLYRPFAEKYFLKVLPRLSRESLSLTGQRSPGALGEPLYLDVKALFQGQEQLSADHRRTLRTVLKGHRSCPRSSPSTTTLSPNEPKNDFTIGIVDDVTFKSLSIKSEVSIVKPGTTECKFYGLGSDGTVGANKNTIKIIGSHTQKMFSGLLRL